MQFVRAALLYIISFLIDLIFYYFMSHQARKFLGQLIDCADIRDLHLNAAGEPLSEPVAEHFSVRGFPYSQQFVNFPALLVPRSAESVQKILQKKIIGPKTLKNLYFTYLHV